MVWRGLSPPYHLVIVMILDDKLNIWQFLPVSWKILKRKYDGFPYQGLQIFTGEQGAGKTLKMMHVLHRMAGEYPSALVVSNMTLYGLDYIPYEGIDQLSTLSNGKNGIIYVIDEIQTLFSSLESKDMPPSTLTVWSQNRKNRRVILGTTQRFTRVAKGIREQVSYHIECASPILGLFRYRYIDASLYDENGKLPAGARPPFYSFYVPKLTIMDSYDTGEVITRKETNQDGISNTGLRSRRR